MKRINVNLLTKLTKKSHHNHFNHATLIMKSGRILAQGYNHKFMHSEEHAILKIGNPFSPYYKPFGGDTVIKGATFINFMVRRKTGSSGNSRPCEKCWNKMVIYGVRKVIYFNGTEFVEERVK